MSHQTLVLLNPRAAGGRTARVAAPMRDWLRVHSAGTMLHVSAGMGDSVERLRGLPRGSRVVVAGGDGTLPALLPTLLSAQLSLGLVPLGSGNDCARALGLHGMAWPAALRHALDAQACAMDVGEVRTATDQGMFLSSLACGFDAAVGARALAGPARLTGLPRYLWATLGEIACLRNWPIEVRADGQLLHQGLALFASCLNTPSYGGGMPVVPHARVDDGQLNLLLAGRFGRLGTLLVLPRLLAARHLSHARVQTCGFADLSLSCPLPLPLALDGEPMPAATQVQVRVLAGALRCVPRR